MGSFDKKQARLKRKRRIRKHITGTAERPRLSVFRSAKHIYAQVIDDIQGITLAAASSVETAVKENAELAAAKGKQETAGAVGKLIAERLDRKRRQQSGL